MNIHKAAALLFVLMAGTLVYAVANFTVPPVTIPPNPVAGTSSPCPTLAQPSGITHTTGVLRFNCTVSSGAFTVDRTGSNTPSFTLPAGYTSIGYVSHSATDCTGSITLISGAQITLSSTGEFDLCANYTVPAAGATLASFTFAWAS